MKRAIIEVDAGTEVTVIMERWWSWSTRKDCIESSHWPRVLKDEKKFSKQRAGCDMLLQEYSRLLS